MARLLLEHGADADAWDGERRKPLHFAMLHGADAVVQVLLPATYTIARDVRRPRGRRVLEKSLK